MKSIGREPALQDLLLQIGRAFDDDGAFRRGRKVHVSVSAPARGGLSLFLTDVEKRLEQDQRVTPILVQVDDSQNPDAALLPMLRDLARSAGCDEPRSFELHTLFSVCADLARGGGRVPVLLLDVGEALGHVEANAALRREASRNQLLDLLRTLGTLMVDHDAKLITVVGWRSSFPPISPQWEADDVVQRFYPSIVLRPHFDLDDSTQTWSFYQQVLEREGITVDGSYPGFCRSMIPVGEVVQQAREREVSRVDGAFLLETLFREPRVDKSLRDEGFDQNMLIDLCLRDQAIAPDDDRRQLIERSGIRAFVIRNDEGHLVASGDLYGRLGLHPPHALLSLEEKTRFRFSQERDPDLCADIIRGYAAEMEANELEVPEMRGAFAAARLKVLNARYLPPTFPSLVVDVFCCLEDPLPDELVQSLGERAQKIENQEGGLATGVILLLTPHEEARVVARRVAKGDEDRLVTLRGSAQTRILPGLRVENITEAHAVQAVCRIVDPSAGGKNLEQSARCLQRHYSDLQFPLPRLAPEDFSHQVVLQLRRNAYKSVQLSKLREACGISVGRLNDVRRRLGALGVVPVARGNEAEWTYKTDELLRVLMKHAGPGLRAELHNHYIFARDEWLALAKNLAAEYGDFLLLDKATLTVKSAVPWLQARAKGLVDEVMRRIDALEVQTEDSSAPKLRKDCESIERAIDAAGEDQLDALCTGLVDLLGQAEEEQRRVGKRGAELREAVREHRAQLKEKADSGISDLERERTALLSASLPEHHAELKKHREAVIACRKRFEKIVRGRREYAVSVKLHQRRLSQHTNRWGALVERLNNQSDSADRRLVREDVKRLKKVIETLASLLEAAPGPSNEDLRKASADAQAGLEEVDRNLTELEMEVDRLRSLDDLSALHSEEEVQESHETEEAGAAEESTQSSKPYTPDGSDLLPVQVEDPHELPEYSSESLPEKEPQTPLDEEPTVSDVSTSAPTAPVESDPTGNAESDLVLDAGEEAGEAGESNAVVPPPRTTQRKIAFEDSPEGREALLKLLLSGKLLVKAVIEVKSDA